MTVTFPIAAQPDTLPGRRHDNVSRCGRKLFSVGGRLDRRESHKLSEVGAIPTPAPNLQRLRVRGLEFAAARLSSNDGSRVLISLPCSDKAFGSIIGSFMLAVTTGGSFFERCSTRLVRAPKGVRYGFDSHTLNSSYPQRKTGCTGRALPIALAPGGFFFN